MRTWLLFIGFCLAWAIGGRLLMDFEVVRAAMLPFIIVWCVALIGGIGYIVAGRQGAVSLAGYSLLTMGLITAGGLVGLISWVLN